MYRTFALALLEAVLLSVSGSTSAVAQEKHEFGDVDARAFLDKLVTDHMAADDVLGASVVVVKEGKLWYEKGYGFADEQKTRRVDPQSTEFFAASISKLFVASAAMQLVEQGRLDLHRDINQYLDFRISPFHDSRPITLGDLLTHTAGVDDHMIGAESPIQLPTDLGPYFRKHRPRLIRPPGLEIVWH